MPEIELTVLVDPTQKLKAEEKGLRGASYHNDDNNYEASPHVGHHFVINEGIEPLTILKVIHWGPAAGFAGSWVELIFHAPIDIVELLINAKGWEKKEE